MLTSKMKTMRWALGSILMILLVGCAPGPKNAKLVAFEQQRKQPENVLLRLLAPDTVKKMQHYYNMSVDAWIDGRDAESAELAEISSVYLRAAQVRMEEQKVNRRLERLQRQIDRWNGEISKLEPESKKLSAELKKLVAQQRAGLRGTQISLELLDAIRDAEGAKSKADGLNAKTFAATNYQRGLKALERAKKDAEKKPDSAMKLAKEAKAKFEAAAEEAKPKFEAQKRLERLIQMCERDFGTLSFVEGRTVRIVLPRLFKNRVPTIDERRYFLVDMAVGIAKAFPSTTLVIEGYTRKGKKKRNKKVSQLRAEQVKNYLVKHGVDANRITKVVGYGQSQPRYSNKDRDDKGKNDRVEIIFIMPFK